MLKKLSLLFVALGATLQMSAADVNLATAQNVANAFMNRQVANGRLRASAVSNMKLVKAEASVFNPKAVDYYIFNADKSYVVVAGDDQAPEILMYGEEGKLDMDNIPPAMQWMLNKYKYQIDGIKAGTLKANGYVPKATTAVPPLVNANWDQSAPYNNQCPTSGSSRCLTGCPATSLAMCYYKWKWPQTFPACAAISASNSGGVAAAALPEREADWDNIIDEYTGPTNTSSTSAQKEAVAWLMRYAGQSIPDYMYGTSASGANDPEIFQGVKNMGYTDAQYLLLTELVESGYSYTNGPQQYTDAEWNEFMLNELYNDRPIEYLAYDCSGWQPAGHAFNVFGCDTNGKYYVNWGWSGDSNGYCTLHNFTTNTGATGQSGSYVFNYGEAMIIGIEPPAGALGPNIKASEQEINLTTNVGETATATFTVTGKSLEQNITATLADANGVFSINPTNITMSQAENGQTVTVTFAPQSLGNYTATITLKSSNATDVTVTLNGRAVYAAPVMLPANESFVNINKFRADWTDETPDANLASYTLELNKPVPPSELIGSLSGSSYTNNSYSDITLSAPWGGTNVRGGYGAIYFRNSISYTPSPGNITFTIPEGYNNYIFTLKITTSSSQYGTGNYTVETPQTAAVGKDFTSNGQTHEWLVTASSGEKITITSTDDSYSPDIALIQVYSGDATESGSGITYLPYRLIEGITNKYCDVTELEDGGTYLYRVKVVYNDNTESEWSNMEQVTLFENTSGLRGDVNGDGEVDVRDITALIDVIMNSVTDNPRADVSEDGEIDVRDITALIDIIMNS